MLGIMSEISMDLIGNVFGGSVAGNFVAKIIGESGPTGIMETVTQQLGLGLMLSTLLITVPPMAGMWFNGVMATYSGYNAMQGWGTGQPATPPGMNSQSQQIEQRANQVTERLTRQVQPTNASTSTSTPHWTGGNPAPGPGTDPNAIKTPLQTQYGLAGGSPKLHPPTPQPKPDPKQQPDDSI